MINPYLPIPGKVLDIIEETPNIKTFILKLERTIPFEAGQFVELTVPGVGEAPFTPSSSPFSLEKIEMTIMKVGKVTNGLFDLKPGDSIGMRGPFGQRYPLEKFENKEIFIVGGGVGLAPLRSLFLALAHDINKYKKIYIRYGARTPQDVVYKYLLPKWKTWKGVDLLQTVDVGDKGWKGRVGVVTTILDKIPLKLNNSVAVVCGPPIMMKFVTIRLLEAGFAGQDIYLSMEKNMSCGIGQCRHCRMGKFLTCRDGPVLTWEQVKDIEDPFL